MPFKQHPTTDARLLMAAVLAMLFSPVATLAAPADLTAIPAAVACSARP
ncbi:hypothetical protein [Martelella alba]|nr:hypothetical protein [Martelella alba]